MKGATRLGEAGHGTLSAKRVAPVKLAEKKGIRIMNTTSLPAENRTGRMAEWSMKVATPLTIALFAVVAATGVMMFFHVKSVEGLHIWASLAFVLAAVLHTFRNWRPFLRQFRLWPVWAGLTVAVAVTLFFVIANPGPPSGGRGHGPRGGHGPMAYENALNR